METFLWIFYDTLLFAVGYYWLLERTLTLREKRIVAVVVLFGIALACFGLHSDRQEYLERVAAQHQIGEAKKEASEAKDEATSARADLRAFRQAWGEYFAVLTNKSSTADDRRKAQEKFTMTVQRSPSIGSGGGLTGEVVIRDETGRVVHRSKIK
jgi:hypothetical protein